LDFGLANAAESFLLINDIRRSGDEERSVGQDHRPSQKR
jgi:hypothetical protein